MIKAVALLPFCEWVARKLQGNKFALILGEPLEFLMIDGSIKNDTCLSFIKYFKQ